MNTNFTGKKKSNLGRMGITCGIYMQYLLRTLKVFQGAVVLFSQLWSPVCLP